MGFLIGLIIAVTTGMTSSAAALHVIVDPGHGGKDRGAVRGKVQEAPITLDVSNKLANLLSKDPRFSVSLTRDQDTTLSLKNRALFARRQKGDVFISIHVNASVDSRAKGAEFYFQNQLPPDEESMFLAHKENAEHSEDEIHGWPLVDMKGTRDLKPDIVNIIQDLQRNFRLHLSGQLSTSLVQSWQGSRRSQRNSIRQAPFYVVSNVNMPSTLVELGFLTNKDEARQLTSKAYQSQVAKSIFDGLVRFKEVMDKEPLLGLE